MDTLQALNSAIYNERLAMEHYSALAEVVGKSGDPSVAQFFEDQSNREKGHFNSLMKQKERLFPEGSDVAVGETVKWITREVTAESGAQAGLDDALKVVEEAEKTAQKFYLDAAKGTEDQEVKELFEKLAEEEDRHHRTMGRLRVILETKGKIDPPDFEDLGMG